MIIQGKRIDLTAVSALLDLKGTVTTKWQKASTMKCMYDLFCERGL